MALFHCHRGSLAMRTVRFLPAAALLFALAMIAPTASAVPPMLPGLWELRVATTIAKREMPPLTNRECLTQADIDDPLKTLPRPEGDCKLTNIKTSGGRTSYDMACKLDALSVRGHMEIVTSAESYDGMNDLTFDGVGVKNERGVVIVNAKRIGECTK
jgi:Protein of unknown function (DUF3617)